MAINRLLGGYIGNYEYTGVPQLVGLKAQAWAGTTTQTTVTFPSNTLVEGDLVIAYYSVAHSANASITIDTANYTYLAANNYLNSTYDLITRVAYKFMTSTPDTSIVFSNTASNIAAVGGMGYAIVRGIDPANPIEASNTYTSITSGVVNPTPVTTLSRNSMVVVLGSTAYSGVATTYTASDLGTFVYASQIDTTDTIVGIGATTRNTPGTFDPAAWTWSGTDGSTLSAFGATIALRPKPIGGIFNLNANYQTKVIV